MRRIDSIKAGGADNVPSKKDEIKRKGNADKLMRSYDNPEAIQATKRQPATITQRQYCHTPCDLNGR